jgi:hypothetical protein
MIVSTTGFSYNFTERLEFIGLDGNMLTATIPAEFFQLVTLQDIFVQDNLLSGPLPANPEFDVLASVVLYGNYISQTIPSYFSDLYHLEDLSFQSNFFSGTIPSELSTNVNIEALEFAANMLSKSLPSELANAVRLQVLNVSDNFLTGEITELFRNESTLVNLQLLDLSLNGFSGSIPENLFKPRQPTHNLQLLELVVMYSNCFEGALPDSICTSPQLTTLVLDALTSAPGCRKKFPVPLNSIIKAVISKDLLDGTIPSCIWTMPTLVTLHLSGNGIVGTLGDLVQGATNLQDVSLANNRLVGSIPQSWQTWGKFTQLDLSSNKLSGTLSSQFVPGANNSKLDLTVNRLSGDIPSSLRTVADVDILQGNLFQCSSNTVPESDPDKEAYVCGSSDFDIYLIVWVCVAAAVFVVAGLNYKHISELLLSAESVHSTNFLRGLAATSSFLGFIARVSRSCTVIGLLALVFAMSLYVAFKLSSKLSVDYSTHTVQYAWVTTVAYLHGVGPSIVVIVLLFIIVAVIDIGLAVPCRVPMAEYWLAFMRAPSKQCIITRAMIWHYCMIAGVLIVHMATTIIVNVFYVYALIIGVPTSAVIVLQGALSIFKLAWNSWFVVWVLKKLHLSNENHLTCATFMVLFTFLVSPFVATFFSDTACFRYVITTTPAVTSTFLANQFSCQLVCASYGDDAFDCFDKCKVSELAETESTTTVTPSWQYSYQCSSKIVTNYTPVLLFAFTISGILVPAFRLAFLKLPRVVVETYIPDSIRKSVMNNIYYLSDGSVVGPVTSGVTASNASSSSDNDYVAGSLNPVHSSTNSKLGDQTSADVISSPQLPRRAFNPYTVISRYCLNIAVLGTFGLASPLLCLAVIVDSWSTLILLRILIARFVRLHGLRGYHGDHLSPNRNDEETSTRKSSLTRVVLDQQRHVTYSRTYDDNPAVEVLEGTTRDTLAGLPSVVWMVTVMLSMFWCFFVFDMMGDVYGVNVGALMLLLPSFGAIFAHCAAAFYNSKILFPRENNRDNGTTLTKSLLLESGDIGLNESFDSNNSRL